jgi:hypothetical protein
MDQYLPHRTPWGPFPDVVILADIAAVKGHPAYASAKAGDADAASALVADMLADTGPVERLAADTHPTLLSVHAVEGMGVNAIPEALADILSKRLHLPVENTVVQTNVVSHTGASGFARLARQAAFDGDIRVGVDHLR